MHLQLADRLELGKPRRTKEGYLAVRARAARAGVYDYRGREVDPEGKHFTADQVVKVYRPEDEVFARDAVHSFLMKPITNDHPSVPVTADNWSDHAKGINAGALRDGDHLAFDLVVMDAATIADIDAGKRELSNGYGCELEIGDGTAPDGTAFQATQRTIRGNHVAVVDAGRAGPSCRISDGGNALFQNCDAAPSNIDAPKEKPVSKKITLDGLQVDLSDESAVEVAIGKLQGQLKDATTAKDTAEASVATLTTEKATLDAKVVTLEQQLADAKPTPAQLRDAAAAFARTIAQAKALGVEAKDDMDEAAIQKAVVSAKLGDAAKDWTADQIAVSFATLAKDAKVEDAADKVVPIHSAATVTDGPKAVAASRAAWLADKQTAYRGKTA